MLEHEFLNGLRILRSIDLHELQAVGLFMQATFLNAATPDGVKRDGEAWRHFRDNPYAFLIQADAETATAIWTIIERRMNRHGRHNDDRAGRRRSRPQPA